MTNGLTVWASTTLPFDGFTKANTSSRSARPSSLIPGASRWSAVRAGTLNVTITAIAIVPTSLNALNMNDATSWSDLELCFFAGRLGLREDLARLGPDIGERLVGTTGLVMKKI